MDIKLILLLIVISLFLWIIFSLWPSTLLIRYLFKGGVAVESERYKSIKEDVQIRSNISYGSNVYDEYRHKQNRSNNIIVWVHGGAFVAGDKEDIKEYATELAYEGFTVINMNYNLAPNLQYPAQIQQINDLLQHLKKSRAMDSLFLAGDSAGAHMISQFVISQTDHEYAQKIGLKKIIEAKDINGLLLYCGPYDTNMISKMIDDAPLMGRFIFKKISRAYLGDRKLNDVELNIVENLKSSFPPCFITDGNMMSFPHHAAILSKRLDSLSVENKLLLYPNIETELHHEYQFKLDNVYSINTFDETVKFLKSHC